MGGFLKKINPEIVLVILFIIIFSWVGIGSIFDRSINHDLPQGMLASDPFHYYNYIEGYDERGIFDFFPSWWAFNRSNIIQYQPPVYYINSVLLGNMASTQNYDSMNLLMLLGLVSAIMVFYFILRRVHWSLAVLSLPLTYFLFVPNFIFGILWGRQPTMFTEIFLVGIFWAVLRLKDKNIWIVLGIFFAGLAMGHTPQLLFGLAFLVLYFLYLVFSEKKLPMKETKNIIKAGVLSIILAGYYLYIFRITVAKVAGFTFGKVTPAAAGNRFAALLDFKLAIIPIIIGILLLLFMKHKKYLFFSLFMFLVGFTNLFLGKRGIETRFMWPVFLCALFGLTFYYLLSIFKMQKKWIYPALLFVVLSAVILGMYYQSGLGRGSLANKYNWDALNFIKSNTPQGSKVLFGYGDSYSQGAFLGQTKRLNYAIRSNHLIDAYNQAKLKRNYTIGLEGEGQSKGAYWDKEGRIRFYLSEFDRFTSRDICDFDYYVLNKFGRIQQLAQYNLILADYLFSNNDHIELAYQNELVVILKNNQPGMDCMPAEGVKIETQEA